MHELRPSHAQPPASLPPRVPPGHRVPPSSRGPARARMEFPSSVLPSTRGEDSESPARDRTSMTVFEATQQATTLDAVRALWQGASRVARLLHRDEYTAVLDDCRDRSDVLEACRRAEASVAAAATAVRNAAAGTAACRGAAENAIPDPCIVCGKSQSALVVSCGDGLNSNCRRGHNKAGTKLAATCLKGRCPAECTGRGQ